MQLEPYPEKDGYRVWLSKQEQEKMLEKVTEEPTKRLAFEIMLDGLRADELERVCMKDFRKMETEKEGWKLRIWESKTTFRECPVSTETKQRATMLKNARGIREDEPLIDYSKRQVQRWVKQVAAELDEENPEKDWNELSAHDLRRTWATSTYWRLNGDRAREIVMSWGGWVDQQTFVNNYLGRVPDSVAIDVMEEAKLI